MVQEALERCWAGNESRLMPWLTKRRLCKVVQMHNCENGRLVAVTWSLRKASNTWNCVSMKWSLKRQWAS
jgi:hypothetical protein